jgi:hypothetical protein
MYTKTINDNGGITMTKREQPEVVNFATPEKNTEAPIAIPETPKTGMYTKYESMYNLALLGFTPQQVTELTKDDVAIIDGTVTVKGKPLDFNAAAVLASYIADNAHLCHTYLFSGVFGVQSTVKGIKRSVAVHLRKHHGLKLSDIGWTEQAKVAKAVTVIKDMSDIQRIIDELQGKVKE